MNLIYLNVRNLTLAISVFIIAIFSLNSCSKSGSKPVPSNSNKLTISSLSISQGSYYASVTITGTGFDEIFANDQVFFNGKRAAIDMASSTQIFARVPLAAGTGNVTIKVNGASAAGPVFTYIPALVVSTFAGNSSAQGDANGTGDTARFSQLSAIAIDKNDNLYVTDQFTHKIKKITPQAQVTTLAGPGKAGNTDGTVSTATYTYLTGMAVDPQENIFLADAGMLRKITPAGIVSTIPLSYASQSGALPEINGVATDNSGNVYITDANYHVVGKVASNGVITISAGNFDNDTPFENPLNVAADKNGNLFVADVSVFKITPPSTLIKLAPYGPNGLSIEQAEGIAVDATGNIYIADTGNHCIEKVTPTGSISVVTGTFNDSLFSVDGVVNLASLTFPTGVVVDSKGNIFVADAISIRKIAFE
jgi:sugar lactone lactonase YvrE